MIQDLSYHLLMHQLGLSSHSEHLREWSMTTENRSHTQLILPSSTPLYRRLEEHLLEQIASGKIGPGDAIPTERELCELYGVSRITVRRAMHELQTQGYVKRTPGKGTFATHASVRREIGPLIGGYSAEMEAQGRVPGSQLLNLQHSPAEKQTAFLLHLTEGDPIWLVERLRLADDEVISVNVSYLRLPPETFLTPMELRTEVSLWSILQQKGIHIAQSDNTIKAIAANEHYAGLLGVEEGAPLLSKEGVNYSDAEVPIEAFWVVSRADRYEYFVRLASSTLQ
jgi:GntR family transcriptional regulator